MGDKLIYFELYGRAEAIRMLYALANKQLVEEKISYTDWPTRKPGFPMQQLPVMETDDGVINQSTTIARYVAKRFGLNGTTAREEILNDMILENVSDLINSSYKIVGWKVKWMPEPENSAEEEKKMKDTWLMFLNWMEKINQKNKAHYLVGEKLMVGDVTLYSALRYANIALPDMRTLTPWTTQFMDKVEKNETMAKYLEERPKCIL